MYIHQVEENRFIQTGIEGSPKLVKKEDCAALSNVRQKEVARLPL